MTIRGTTPTRRLIADMVRRRNRLAVLLFAALVGAAWWWAPDVGQRSRAIALSMGVAFTMGPQMTLWMVPRAIWYLPMSRREVWRAGWFVSVIATSSLLAAAKIVAVLVPSGAPLGFASVALSALLDFAAAGVGCGLVILATRPRPGHGPLQRGWPMAKGLAELLLPVGYFAAYYMPMWLAITPPARWSELTPFGGALLAATVALTIATWFYSPIPQTPANRLRPTARVSRSAVQVPKARFTGMPRLLVREAGWTFALGGGLAAFASIVIILMARLASDRRYLMELLRDLLHVGDLGAATRQDLGAVGFNLVLWYAVFAAAVAARFPLIIRHLRVLPIGAARLHALLLAWPTVIWLVAWGAAAALHYAVLGYAPTRMHGPAILAVIGISALVQSVTMGFSTVARGIVCASAAGLLPFLGLVSPPPPFLLALLGAASLAGAAGLNRLALSRSGTYRAVPLPIPATQWDRR